jgi:hypothetical protein
MMSSMLSVPGDQFLCSVQYAEYTKGQILAHCNVHAVFTEKSFLCFVKYAVYPR